MSLVDHIRDVMGENVYANLPVLSLENSPHTDYIDFVQPEDMTSSLMKGVDYAGRPFLAIRYFDESDQTRKAIVVFQRYVAQNRPWCNGTSFYKNIFDSRVMGEEQIKDFDSLLRNGKANITKTNWSGTQTRLYTLI